MQNAKNWARKKIAVGIPVYNYNNGKNYFFDAEAQSIAVAFIDNFPQYLYDTLEGEKGKMLVILACQKYGVLESFLIEKKWAIDKISGDKYLGNKTYNYDDGGKYGFTETQLNNAIAFIKGFPYKIWKNLKGDKGKKLISLACVKFGSQDKKPNTALRAQVKKPSFQAVSRQNLLQAITTPIPATDVNSPAEEEVIPDDTVSKDYDDKVEETQGKKIFGMKKKVAIPVLIGGVLVLGIGGYFAYKKWA